MAVGGAATAAAVDIGQTSPVPDGCRGSPSAGGLWLGGISWEGERGRGQQCVREHGEHGIGHGGEGGKEGAWPMGHILIAQSSFDLGVGRGAV